MPELMINYHTKSNNKLFLILFTFIIPNDNETTLDGYFAQSGDLLTIPASARGCTWTVHAVASGPCRALIRQWLRAVWLPLADNGDATTPPKPLLKLPVLFVGVRRSLERKSVFAII